MARVERVETVDDRAVVAEPAGNVVAARVVYLIAGIIEVLLGLRLLFRAFGANPQAAFVRFVYDLSAPLVAPFQGIFRSPSTQGNVVSATLDMATLIAMIVYALLAWIILRALTLASRRVVD